MFKFPLTFLSNGKSGICRVGKQSSIGKLAKGDVFGEVSFLLGGTATCTVVAHTPVTVVRVTKQVLQSLFSVRPDLACKFYRYFAAGSFSFGKNG